jgi:hypothetical protein
MAISPQAPSGYFLPSPCWTRYLQETPRAHTKAHYLLHGLGHSPNTHNPRFDEPTRRDEPRSHFGSQARGRKWFCCRLAAAGAERSFPPPSPRPHGSVNKARPFLSSPPESRSHLPAGPSGHERGSSPSVPAARHLFARALPAAAYSSFGIVPCAPVKPLLA